MKTNIISIGFLLLTVGIGMLFMNYYNRNTTPSKSNSQTSASVKQDQFLSMDKITLRRYNEDAQLSMILTADTANQAGPSLPLELANQIATSFEWIDDKKNTQITLQSPYGQYSSSAGLLSFCQQREVCNNNQLEKANQKPYLVELIDLRTIPPTFIKSSALIYDIDGKLVSNEHPTAITRGASVFTGTGLRANIATRDYQLLHDVKTVLVPTPDTGKVIP